MGFTHVETLSGMEPGKGGLSSGMQRDATAPPGFTVIDRLYSFSTRNFGQVNRVQINATPLVVKDMFLIMRIDPTAAVTTAWVPGEACITEAKLLYKNNVIQTVTGQQMSIDKYLKHGPAEISKRMDLTHDTTWAKGVLDIGKPVVVHFDGFASLLRNFKVPLNSYDPEAWSIEVNLLPKVQCFTGTDTTNVLPTATSLAVMDLQIRGVFATDTLIAAGRALLDKGLAIRGVDGAPIRQVLAAAATSASVGFTNIVGRVPYIAWIARPTVSVDGSFLAGTAFVPNPRNYSYQMDLGGAGTYTLGTLASPYKYTGRAIPLFIGHQAKHEFPAPGVLHYVDDWDVGTAGAPPTAGPGKAAYMTVNPVYVHTFSQAGALEYFGGLDGGWTMFSHDSQLQLASLTAAGADQYLDVIVYVQKRYILDSRSVSIVNE